jgi:hypothetical protein
MKWPSSNEQALTKTLGKVSVSSVSLGSCQHLSALPATASLRSAKRREVKPQAIYKIHFFLIDNYLLREYYRPY